MATEEEIIEIKKTITILANQNVQLHEEIIKLITSDTNQVRLINHQGAYLSSLNGQINLLLQFILSEPSSLLSFASFAKIVANITVDNQKEMKTAAQWLLDNGLQQFVPQAPGNAPTPPNDSSHSNTNQAGSHPSSANVIQFPKPPKNDAHDP